MPEAHAVREPPCLGCVRKMYQRLDVQKSFLPSGYEALLTELKERVWCSYIGRSAEASSNARQLRDGASRLSTDWREIFRLSSQVFQDYHLRTSGACERS